MSIYLASLEIDKSNNKQFPFCLPILQNGLKIEFDSPITFIVGGNGAGKSTLLENLAYKVGFNHLGGNKNHTYDSRDNCDNLDLADKMKIAWELKTSKGFFFRAESFLNFAEYLDEMALEDANTYLAYGGESLQKQSHGESFLSLFANKFNEGLFILDEPESALSAERQLSLISILKDLADTNKCQFIIATHSPLLIATPNSKVYEIDDGELKVKPYDETKQFLLYKNFLECPDRYLRFL